MNKNVCIVKKAALGEPSLGDKKEYGAASTLLKNAPALFCSTHGQELRKVTFKGRENLIC